MYVRWLFILSSLCFFLFYPINCSARPTESLTNKNSKIIFSQQFQTEYTTATLSLDHRVIQPNQMIWAQLELNHRAGWHSYWKNPGDSGLETTMVWTSSHQFNFEPILWKNPDLFYLDELVNYGYKEQVKLLMPLQVTAFQNTKDSYAEYVKLSVVAEWLVCEEVCIPEQAEFSFLVLLSNHSSLKSDQHDSIQRVKEDYFNKPSVQIDTKKKGAYLYLNISNVIESVDKQQNFDVYFFADQTGQVKHTKTQKLIEKNQKTYLLLQLEQTKLDLKSGLLRIRSSEGERVLVVNLNDSIKLFSIVVFLGLAFFGGLLLNVMPCVFPVLSLKALSLVQEAQLNPKQVRIQSLSYCLGILVSFYLLVACLQLLALLGYYVGWGFQLQSPTFVFVMMAVMMLVGLHLSNLLHTPQFLLKSQGVFARIKFNSKQDPKHFFTGVLAVFVATPCTAPFMAPALGFALGQHVVVQMLIFTALGFGFALPFLLIGFFPAIQKYLPKSGTWLNAFKQVLAIPMYATAVWLAWVLYNQMGHFALVISCILVSLVIAFVVLQKITFKNHRFKNTVFTFIGVSFFILMSVPSFITDKNKISHMGSVLEIEKHLNAKSRVFVDVTASWCLTCQVNDKWVLSQPKIQDVFKKNNVEFVVLDWTSRNDEITTYLKQFNRLGVPLYIFYNEKGEAQVLPQLLTPKLIKDLVGHKN